MTKISVSEIEILFKLITEKLKKDSLNEFEINIDEYWIVLPSEWCDFKRLPDPAVGSLNEDLEYLRKSIQQNVIISYSDLDRLATVLRVISEQQAPSVVTN